MPSSSVPPDGPPRRAALAVALTCGEPAGIGPELAVKARVRLGADVAFFWIGDPRHLPAEAAWQEIASPAEAPGIAPGTLPVLRHDFPAPAQPGTPDPRNAAAVIEAVARGFRLVTAGEASALCTLPVSKKALKEGAGFAFPGHTEFLAHLAGDVPVAMMLACDALRVVPATIHIALRDVPAALTAGAIATAVRLTDRGLRQDFGIAAPRIAVAGLNPHAGEGGAMGTEDRDLIAPVLASLRAEGLDLTGPLPADTMFRPEARARYDAAVCMYHDQALIPIKTLDFAGGVNVTLGLPVVRTSPDHGTAFDIAGRGIADPSSTVAAPRLARDRGRRRGG